MKSAKVVVRAAALGLGSLLAVAPALAAPVGGGGNGQLVTVPTLGGVGLAALAGALSIGGAWLLSRNRDKQK